MLDNKSFGSGLSNVGFMDKGGKALNLESRELGSCLDFAFYGRNSLRQAAFSAGFSCVICVCRLVCVYFRHFELINVVMNNEFASAL